MAPELMQIIKIATGSLKQEDSYLLSEVRLKPPPLGGQIYL